MKTKKQQTTGRRGRPAKKPEDRAVRRIQVRVTASQEREIQELASKQNLTVSEMFRAYVVAAAVAVRNPGEVVQAMRDDSASITRVVDQAVLESMGQLRAPGV